MNAQFTNAVDAHQHYWRLERGDYDWLTPQLPALYRNFEPADLSVHLKRGGIASTVLVQAAATEAETRYLIGLAQQHASIAGIVGWVDFEARDVGTRLRALRDDSDGKLKGVRPMIQDIADPAWLDRASLDAAFDALVAGNLSFDALVKPPQLERLRHRLQKHPGLRAVLDHAGKPDIAHWAIDARAFDTWALQIERLANETSLCCKLSGLLTEASDAQAADTPALSAAMDDTVAHIFSCFGADRILWGSDWPVLTLRASYEEWQGMAAALVARHAPGQQQAVFATNARRFYRLTGG